VVTPLVRSGQEVAVVVHDASGTAIAELRRAAGPAARLAVDNERLRAELLLRLEELRASRARLVETGDSERQALERDLHDGAQHRLLALGHDVRRVREAAGDRDDRLTAALLAAERGVQAAVADLRAVARGLYPAVLTADGLEGALWSLSDSAPVPFDVHTVPGGRYPEQVERTVYAVAVEALEAARRRDPDGADGVRMEVREAGGRLVVRVDGAVGAPAVTVVDRVGALGGVVDGRRTGWHVELPCG
jgi:signal transduction histidine kinase